MAYSILCFFSHHCDSLQYLCSLSSLSSPKTIIKTICFTLAINSCPLSFRRQHYTLPFYVEYINITVSIMYDIFVILPWPT